MEAGEDGGGSSHVGIIRIKSIVLVVQEEWLGNGLLEPIERKRREIGVGLKWPTPKIYFNFIIYTFVNRRR